MSDREPPYTDEWITDDDLSPQAINVAVCAAVIVVLIVGGVIVAELW
jgi:hypothetical protein